MKQMNTKESRIKTMCVCKREEVRWLKMLVSTGEGIYGDIWQY